MDVVRSSSVGSPARPDRLQGVGYVPAESPSRAPASAVLTGRRACYLGRKVVAARSRGERRAGGGKGLGPPPYASGRGGAGAKAVAPGAAGAPQAAATKGRRRGGPQAAQAGGLTRDSWERRGCTCGITGAPRSSMRGLRAWPGRRRGPLTTRACGAPWCSMSCASRGAVRLPLRGHRHAVGGMRRYWALLGRGPEPQRTAPSRMAKTAWRWSGAPWPYVARGGAEVRPWPPRALCSQRASSPEGPRLPDDVVWPYGRKGVGAFSLASRRRDTGRRRGAGRAGRNCSPGAWASRTLWLRVDERT